jgi:hypothetical protein
MQSEQLGPIEPRKMRFPVPPVSTAFWEPADWDRWVATYGELEPLVLRFRNTGEWHAVGRNDKGELVYRLNTNGEV